MLFCTSCGNQLSDSDRFCAKCGRQLTPLATVAPFQTVPSPIDQGSPVLGKGGLVDGMRRLEKKNTQPRSARHLEDSDFVGNAWNELLVEFTKKPVDRIRPDYWEPYLDLQVCLQEMIVGGYLVEAPVAVKLDKAYRLTDIKAWLKERGMKTTGKKATLISSLVEAAPAQMAAIAVDIQQYVPTAFGQRTIKAWVQSKEDSVGKTKILALAFLRHGDIDDAARGLYAYSRAFQFPHKRYDMYKKGVSDRQKTSTSYLLKQRYADLEIPESSNGEIAVRLALLSLGFGKAELLLEVTGSTFSCPSMVDFIISDACPRLKDQYNVSKISDMLSVYVHTKLNEANGEAELAELQRESDVVKGVEILPVRGDNCKICSRGNKKHLFSDLGQMPRIPRHWGCRCCYLSWTKSDKELGF